MSKLHAVLEALTLCLSSLILSFSLWAWLDKSPSVGIPLPQGAAVFETSLQSRISSTDTSMTLVSNSLRGGESLSGFNCFTLDEGRSDSEFVCGSVSGTSVTSLERGLSFANGTTSVTANKFAHRVGANVKITDFPLIQRQRNILNGEETVPNPLLLNGATSSGIIVYSSAPSFQPGSNQLITANYADGIAAQGAATSSESAGGISILATAIRQASSTDLGANQPLVLQAKYASSTPRLGCNGTATRGALCTVIAQNDGMIHPNFLATTSSYTYRIDSNLFFNNGFVSAASTTFTASTTFASRLFSFATSSFAVSSPLSNAIIFNGVSYGMPSTQGASSTVWANNGSGTFTNNTVGSLGAGYFLGGTTTDETWAGGDSKVYGDGTVIATIPAGLMGTNGAVEFTVYISDYEDSSVGDTGTFTLKFGATTVCELTLGSEMLGGGSTAGGFVTFIVYNNNSASSQVCLESGMVTGLAASTGGISAVGDQTSAVNTATAQAVSLEASVGNGGGTEAMTLTGAALKFLGRP